MSSAVVRLGLAGLGWGERVAAAAATLPGVRFTACYARTAETRRAFAARHGLEAADSFARLLAREDLDGVVLMTPNSTHCPLTLEALAAGKPVLVTKPIATSMPDARRMIAAAGRGGLLTVGHQSRRHPALRRLRTLIAAGVIGTPRHIEGNTSSPTGQNVSAHEWRASDAECPGGPLMQLGIHYVDNFQHFLGPVRAVAATFSRSGVMSVDSTQTRLRFASDATGELVSSYVADYARWIRVSGDAGSLSFAADGSLTLEAGGRAERILPPVADREEVLRGMLAEELAEFAQCVRTGTPPEITARDGARNLAVVLAAVASAANAGRETPVEDV